MYPLLEHPEIGHITRTGYPSHIRDRDYDDVEDDYEDIDGYYNEDAIFDERRESGLLAEE